jgi:hypothetical protein
VKDVLLVPVSAVLTDWRGNFVFDAAGLRRDIVGGEHTATEVGVQSGLEAGEWILGTSSESN